jgi:acyl carrier protein phosphodiesterase
VFDHFLSLDTAETPQEGWEIFSQSVYVHLESQSSFLPETFKRVLPYMIQYNWLANYHHIHSIEKSFQGIARRAKFLEDALPAFRLFESEYLLFQKIYADFFPELKEFAQTRMQELSAV